MADMWRVTADWSGGKIGTGFTNFYFTAGVGTATQASDAARKFLSDSYSIGALLPTGVTINWRANIDLVNSDNGALINTVPVTQPATITGSDSTRYAAVAGACVTWRTNDFVGGRRVRGRTFLVPMGGAGLQADGTIDTTALGFINTAAAALISASPEFIIWHRPASLAAGGGSTAVVVAGVCADKTAFLTSRR